MEQRKAELRNLDEKRKIAEEQLDIKKEYETIRIHYETEEKSDRGGWKSGSSRSGNRSGQSLSCSTSSSPVRSEVPKEQIRAQEDQEVRLKERKSAGSRANFQKRKTEKSGRTGVLLAKGKQEQVSLTEADYRLEADATTAMLSHLEMQIEDGKNEIISLF